MLLPETLAATRNARRGRVQIRAVILVGGITYFSITGLTHPLMRAKEFVKENSLSLFFLTIAVGSFAVLVVFLRQRGSPESKPVGASTQDATGQEG